MSFCFLGPYNKTLNFHCSMKKHEIERKVLLTEIMQSTFTSIPTLFLIYFLCKVYALSLSLSLSLSLFLKKKEEEGTRVWQLVSPRENSNLRCSESLSSHLPIIPHPLVVALSLLYMHKNIYTYIPILPSFPSLSPTTLT